MVSVKKSSARSPVVVMRAARILHPQASKVMPILANSPDLSSVETSRLEWFAPESFKKDMTVGILNNELVSSKPLGRAGLRSNPSMMAFLIYFRLQYF